MIEWVTDRSAEDVRRGTAKGFYNAADMNRVEQGVQELLPLLQAQGYYVQPQIKTNWKAGDLPSQSQLARYLKNVRQMGATVVADPGLPQTMAGLTYAQANAIENTLKRTEEALPEMQAAYRPSGTFEAGA